MDNDLSPTLGGGPKEWTFEARRPSTVFKMPADMERDQKLIEEIRARAQEAIAMSTRELTRLERHRRQVIEIASTPTWLERGMGR